MQSDDDSIEVHIHERRRLIELDCGHAAFIRILDFLRAEAALNDELPSDSVSGIWITDAGGYTSEPPSYWKDRVALIGCSVVVFIVAFVFVMGVLAIAGLSPFGR